VTQEAWNGPVIILTISPWDEPKRLRKQIAEVLATECEVVYVTLPFGMSKPAANVSSVDGRVQVVSLRGPLVPLRVLLRFRPLRFLYEWRLLSRLRRSLPTSAPAACLLCFTPLYPDLLARLPAQRRVYVANDDHAGLASNVHEKERLRRVEKESLAHCHSVITVSEVLARQLQEHGKPVHVMYPGHDCPVLPIERFDHPRVPQSVCFFGYIDWRVDFDLLQYLLENGVHVALIGPVVGTEDKVAAMSQRYQKRLEILPPLTTASAPEVLTRYQVLVIPYRYRSGEQAEVLEMPNKTFIYFAALRPIVTTFMPNLKLVEPGLVYRSRSNEEFLANCQRAIEEDSIDHARKRRDIALQNTWDARRRFLRRTAQGLAQQGGESG